MKILHQSFYLRKPMKQQNSKSQWKNEDKNNVKNKLEENNKTEAVP